MAVPKKADPTAVMESVLIEGDLAKLTPEQRTKYYNEVCGSLGLNPLTRPFQYIVLNGRLQLYALRACTDQLRKIHGISLEIVSRDVSEDTLTVHVRAKDRDGRIDEDIGVVPFHNLRGDNRANTEMKAVTKAKRRATLSLCGLGWLDESEIETIKDAKPVAGPDAMATNGGKRNAAAEPAANPYSASAADAATPDRRDGALSIAEIQALEQEARQAAQQGSQALSQFWKGLKTQQQQNIISGLRSELVALRDAADEKLREGVDPLTGEVLAEHE
jgi:hypothetical protein